MNKKIILLIILLVSFISLIQPVSAHCPLCTGAAVMGVGVARFYGIDDSIVGLFLGALVASSSLWFNKWLKKKINIPFQGIILLILIFLSLAIPLYAKELITNFEMVKSMPEHHSILGLGVYGIDKLLFGMIFGTLLITGIFTLSDYIITKRGKRLFAFQGAVLMTTALIVLSLIFWIIT